MLAGVRARQADRASVRSALRNRQENWVALGVGVDRVYAGLKPSLDPLSQLLGSELDRVNQLIVERMQSPAELIPQLAGHLVASGGQRLRPMLTLGCGPLCGYSGSRHIALPPPVKCIPTAAPL